MNKKLLLMAGSLLTLSKCYVDPSPSSSGIDSTPIHEQSNSTQNNSSSSINSSAVVESSSNNKTPLESSSNISTAQSPSNSDSVSNTPAEDVKEPHWNDDETLSILTIGNSFSDDAMEYAAKIALSLGIKKVSLGNLYIGGCSIQKHFNNFIKDLPDYEYRTNDGTGWKTTYNYKMKDAISSQKWDFVSLQQASGLSGQEESYEPYLTNMVGIIKEFAPEAKIAWHMTWAYQQDSNHSDFPKYSSNQMTMYSSIIESVKTNVVGYDEISVIIPNGTAIQNMRTSFVGDTLTRDGYHLSFDIGRYIAGLTLVKSLTNLELTNVYSPLIPIYQKAVEEAVCNAIEKPFEVSNSTYLNEPSIDTTQYNLIDLELTQFGYYNSTDVNTPTKIITAASNSVNYFATKRFTQEEIPVGSIIVIENGWQYRPEAWKNEETQSSRPNNVSVKYFVVDEAFWNGYTYRAFNISKTNTEALNGYVNEATNALKIYVKK